jgi:hypothetical protein
MQDKNIKNPASVAVLTARAAAHKGLFPKGALAYSAT